jgi:hypothetical protein
MPLSSSTPVDPHTSVVLLLKPRQAAWIRSHAGRRGASAFMRALLDGLIEEEHREVERVRQHLSGAIKTAAR